MSARGQTSSTGQGTATDEEQTESDHWSGIDQLERQHRDADGDLGMDEVFELLKNPRRRMVIGYLQDNDGSSTLSEVAEHIAAIENDITVHELSSDQRKRVYIGLYQCHLPKMDKFGVIDYNKNRGTIELQESVEQLQPYIEVTQDEDEPASGGPLQYSLGVAVLVSVVVLVGVTGIGPLAAIPSVVWVLLSVLGIFGVLGLQFRS